MKPKPMEFSTRCWNCGKESNRIVASDGKTAKPENGNLNLCVYCGSIAIFDDSFPDGARKPNPAESYELSHSEYVQEILRVWRYSQGR